MKMRQLTWRSGPVTVPAWPLHWGPSTGLEHLATMPTNGVLESVERIEDSTLLKLTMRFEAREYVGMLTWDPPPSIEAVEQLLQAHLGREIGAIGDLDVMD
jgi:hypothetical protein